MSYYNGNKLLSQKDKHGKQPEIFVCCGNRTAGKTFFFTRWFFRRWLKNQSEQVGFLYRYHSELADCSKQVLNDVLSVEQLDYEYYDKPVCDGLIRQIFINDKPYGYAIALNDAEKIKLKSHYLTGITRILFDEFQLQSGRYLTNEIDRFRSIHTSIARGGGKQVRYVPVYMVSNMYSVLNPYFFALNCSHLINNNTKFLHLDGCVIEHTVNDSAMNAQKISAFNRALSGTQSNDYGCEYMDNHAFVEKMTGNNNYMATIRFNSELYSIRYYDGLLYVSKNVDNSYPVKYACSINDLTIGFPLIHETFYSTVKYALKIGQIRFQNLECKEMAYNLIQSVCPR